MSYISYQYKLRTSGPMSMGGGDFYTHTFMAEERKVTTHEATACFLVSEDMAGQHDMNGDPGQYESANYATLQYTARGVNGPVMMFSGEEIKKPVYISEEHIGQGVPSKV